jgi:hypothetical protein
MADPTELTEPAPTWCTIADIAAEFGLTEQRVRSLNGLGVLEGLRFHGRGEGASREYSPQAADLVRRELRSRGHRQGDEYMSEQTNLFGEPATAVSVTGSPTSERISDLVLKLLRAAVVEGSILRPLPPADREIYDELNEVLTRLRGKWKRGRGHVFPYDPTEAIAGVIASGCMPSKNPLAYFPTPADLARDIVSGIEIEAPKFVLEPSAGSGSLVAAVHERWPAARIIAVEADPLNVAMLAASGATICEGDFLSVDFGGLLFDVIVMNPPFAVEGDKFAWATHLRRAVSLLANGGVVACIAPRGTWQTSPSKRFKVVRSWLASLGSTLVNHPDGAFAESGTGIRTCTITICDGAAPVAETSIGPQDQSAQADHVAEPVLELDAALALLFESARESDRAMQDMVRMLSNDLGIIVPCLAPEPDDQDWL